MHLRHPQQHTYYVDDEPPLVEERPVEEVKPKAKSKSRSKLLVKEPVDSVQHVELAERVRPVEHLKRAERVKILAHVELVEVLYMKVQDQPHIP